MTEKFRKHVSMLLASAPDCKEKQDIIEEMVSNLCEKYDELTAGGKTPEQAYQEAVSGVGDPGEIIAYIRSAYDLEHAHEARKTRESDPFSGLDETLRGLGSEIEQVIQSSMRALGQGLEEVTRSLKDVSFTKSGPFTVNVEIGAEDEACDDEDDNRFRLPSEGIESLFIQMKAGDLTLGISPDDFIYVTESAPGNLRDDQRLVCETLGKTLKITQGKSVVGTFRWGFGVYSSDVEVLLPQRTWNEVRVVTTSGEISVEQELRARIASFKTASGDVRAEAICCEQLVLETASGDLHLGGAAANVQANSVSGDLTLQDMTVRELSAESISGEMSLRGVFAAIDAHSVSGDIRGQLTVPPERVIGQTVSGDITLVVPENEGFALEYSRVSGDIASDFPLEPSPSGKAGRTAYRDGSRADYSLKTISGDIRLRRKR
ncbi:MAG: hypothetical protein ABT01_02835 [Clostridium sp. SCN 57-10]|nr:MAG: hypothetical protein ABT01_02835 [Clostridium sp. SCN 57-10]